MNETKKVKEELISALTSLMEKYPQMRFGQLVANVASWVEGSANNVLWDVTDEELLLAAQKNLNRNSDQDK